MRLIDADVLFESVGKIKPRNKEHYKSIGEFMYLITNTPTIEQVRCGHYTCHSYETCKKNGWSGCIYATSGAKMRGERNE